MTTIIMASKSGVLVPVLLDDEDARSIRSKLSVGSHGYVQLWDGTRMVLLHRVIMGLAKGDGKYVDHHNGDPLDNQKSNLRVVTNGYNSANLREKEGKLRGATQVRSGRWGAQAKKDGKRIWLGTYDTEEEAAQVSHDWRTANLPGYQVRST